MDRRAFLGVLGVGVTGLSGCLRLREGLSGEQATTESDTSGSSSERGEITLTENWTAEDGIEHIWTDGGTFHFNGYNVAAQAEHGGGVLWSDETSYDGVDENLGADAFATDGRHVVFGYTPDPDGNEQVGGHFHAYDTVSEEKVWTFSAPSDGKHNFTAGATMVDDVVAVATTDYGREGNQEPLVAGIDVNSGEELWRSGPSTISPGFVQYLGSYAGNVYVTTTGSGTQILDPETGSVTGSRESWRLSKHMGDSLARIHMETLFGVHFWSGGLHTYPIGDNGLEWSRDDVGTVTAGPTVDNSLVVVGNESGTVRAFERLNGEPRWDARIEGPVGAVELSARDVWVSDMGTGLAAFDRETGDRVYQSTQPVNDSDLAVIDDVILFGGNEAHAFWIE